MPPDFIEEIRRFRSKIGAVAGPIFPGVRNPEIPMPVELLTQWLASAEKRPDLPNFPEVNGMPIDVNGQASGSTSRLKPLPMRADGATS